MRMHMYACTYAPMRMLAGTCMRSTQRVHAHVYACVHVCVYAAHVDGSDMYATCVAYACSARGWQRYVCNVCMHMYAAHVDGSDRRTLLVSRAMAVRAADVAYDLEVGRQVASGRLSK